MTPLSNNKLRNFIYRTFLEKCLDSKKTVDDIVRLGYRLMRWSRIHPHFFGDNTLRRTAQFLTFHALGLPLDYNNLAYYKIKLSYSSAEKIIQLFEQRIALRIPVEYITQQAEYLGHTFYVNEHVLVPRSLMNTRFQDFLQNMTWTNYRVLDLCTGSGCVGISLALMHPEIKVDLVDISHEALKVAAINIERHGLSERVRCIQSDLFQHVDGRYDLIITNPPYVSRAEYNQSPAEFKNEPKIALESGKDGLDLVHRLLAEVGQYLNPTGKLIAEVGMPAAKRIKRAYRGIRFKWYKYRAPSGKVSLFISPGIFEVEAREFVR